MVGATVSACDNEGTTAASPSVANAPSPAVRTSEEAPPPAPDAEPSKLELLMAKASLAEAIEAVKGDMTDTDDEPSRGAVFLALWATKHLAWSDVAVAQNETSFALVRKDSDAARGKRMCVRGQLIQIRKETVGAATLFDGLMLINYSDIVKFVVVGSTGDLVQQSRARLCGVVTGTYDYANSGGGKGHAISVVGMFDLPANRAPK